MRLSKVINWLSVSEDLPAGSTWSEIELGKQGWIVFLERFNFDAWGTVTYRVPTRSAGTAIRRAVRTLRKFYRGIGVRKIRAFIVAEPHESGCYHAHLLFKCGAPAGDELRRRELLKAIFDFVRVELGRCSFEGVRDQQAVRAYVGKYLIKRSAEWWISPS